MRKEITELRFAKQPLEFPVGHPGVGDADAAVEVIQSRWRVPGRNIVELTFHAGVHPAYKERSDRSDTACRVPTAGDVVAEAVDVRLRRRYVGVQRKEERDVYIDAAADEGSDGWHPFGRAWHLDHHIRPPDRLK